VYQPWRSDDPYIEITYVNGTRKTCVVVCAYFHSAYVVDEVDEPNGLKGKYSHLAGLPERQGDAWLMITADGLNKLIVKHYRNSISKEHAQEILVVIGFGSKLVWFTELM